jgi:uncharacterized membrane protein
MTAPVIVHIILGISLWPVVIVYKLFPPKKINSLYGYRTRRSMKSQKMWDEGNRISANMLLWAAILTNLFQVSSYFLLSPEASILSSAAFMVLALIIMIPLTERRLKEFEKERSGKSEGLT